MKLRLILMFLIMSMICSAVNITMQFTAKKTFTPAKKLKIMVADENGETDGTKYNQSAVALSNYLYFKVTPVTKEDFSEKDIDILKADFRIVQGDKEVKQADLEPLTDDDGKVTSILLTFNKEELALYEQFSFKIAEFNSDSVKLDEKLRREYHEYIDSYELGEEEYNASRYLESYARLQPFISSDIEITSLSYYEKARQMLETSVDQKVKFIGSDYNMIKMKSGSNVDRDFLAKIDSLQKLAVHCDSTFSEYIEKVDSNPGDALDNMAKELAELYVTNFQIYKDEILSDFTRFDYRSNKDKSFISVLTQLLLSRKNLLTLNDPDFDLSLIPEDNESLQYIKEYNFTDEFMELLAMIRDNITTKNVVFDEDSINNLYTRLDQEPEPYYNIYSGINHLLAKESSSFWNNMVKALNKCTESDLLQGLEMLILFNDPKILELDEASRATFVEALDSYSNGDIADTKHKFEMINGEHPDLAVSYYVPAQIADAEGDVFGAYYNYEDVVKYKKEIISAHEYFIYKDLNDKDYQTAEQKIVDVLRNHPAWKLYYLYAKILYEQKKYPQALKVLEENCLPINSNHYGEFILLGDIYYITGDLSKARENYMEAGRLNRDDKLFRERLEGIDTQNLQLNSVQPGE